MKVLQLCNKSPYPPVDGGAIGILNFSKALMNAAVNVKILTLATPKHPINLTEIPDEFINATAFESVFVNTNVNIFRAFFNLFSNKSYHIERFVSSKVNIALKKILSTDHFDVVILESIFVAPYISTIRKYSNAAVVLRAHNVEHEIWERLAQNSNIFLKKQYLHLLAQRLKKYELTQLNLCDGVMTVTDKDLNYFKANGCTKPIIKIPFGITNTVLNENIAIEYPSLFYIGAMDWQPNKEGILWFLKDIWPIVHQKFPHLLFYLAGRKMSDSIYRQTLPNVVVLGEVEDAFAFMRSKAIMVVPLLSGSGIRVKIIETMDAERAVISTTIGAEGIDYKDGENILIANTPDEFLKAIEKLVSSQNYCEKVGKSAKELVANEHNIDLIVQKEIDFFRQLNKNK